MTRLDCFKAYDVRGRVGSELTPEIVGRIARAFAVMTGAAMTGARETGAGQSAAGRSGAGRIVLGRDSRLSSPGLAEAAAEGLLAEGVEVVDLGLSGTEEMYFAVSHCGADGGMTITASHNPAEDNGIKMVLAGSAPLGGARSLAALRGLAEDGAGGPARSGGRRYGVEGLRAAYVARVLSFCDPAALPALTILVDAGNGAAGPTFDALAGELARRGAPLRFVRMRHDPDGRFPQGVPNPLLPENRAATAEAVVACGADMGVAWDGDFDRCFLFDHHGRFVPGEAVAALLAQAMLRRHPGAAIVHDARVVWNIRDAVAGAGGRAVQTRTGHNFMKAAMRDSGAVYGGELSAHHYFRDFMACDSGMIPWLLVAGLLAPAAGRSLADLVAGRCAAFPSSGEINFRHPDPAAAIARVRAALAPLAASVDETDGLGLAFADWRFNLRASNTEPLLRLNVEARGSAARMRAGVERVTALIGPAST